MADEPIDLKEFYTPGDHPHARVAVNVGRSLDYSEFKVSVTLTLECDQTSAVVEAAAWRAFVLSKEYADAGFSLLIKEKTG